MRKSRGLQAGISADQWAPAVSLAAVLFSRRDLSRSEHEPNTYHDTICRYLTIARKLMDGQLSSKHRMEIKS